jgi:DNA-binding transcriptional LysR family regulator
MDYKKIELFLAAARHANMTVAAEELGLSQPALSKGIKALEKDLGVQLLERGRFGVVPTTYGAALMHHAQVIEAEMRNAKEEIEALKGAQTGHVLLGCGPTEANRLLPLALNEFAQEHPHLRCTVLYGLNESLMPMLKNGELDFALSSIPSQLIHPDLVQETLFTETASVVCGAEHPLINEKVISAQMLMAYPWILPRKGEMERAAFDDFFIRQEVNPPLAVVETTSTALMKSWVMQSNALTFIPKELIFWEEKAGQLVELKIPAAAWTRRVGLSRRKKGSISPAGRVLIEKLRRIARENFD